MNTADTAPADGRTAYVEALALQRWAGHLAHLTHREEQEAKKIIRRAIKDIERGERRAYSRQEREAVEAALTIRFLGYILGAGALARSDADALTAQLPEVAATLAKREGHADG